MVEIPQGHEVGDFLLYNALTAEQANWVVDKALKQNLKVFKKYYPDGSVYSILVWPYTDEATYLHYVEALAKEHFIELTVSGS